MILIKVNGDSHQFSTSLTLQELVEELKVQTKGIAIAINYNVIKKEEWSKVKLRNHDVILIIKSTQGG